MGGSVTGGSGRQMFGGDGKTREHARGSGIEGTSPWGSQARPGPKSRDEGMWHGQVVCFVPAFDGGSQNGIGPHPERAKSGCMLPSLSLSLSCVVVERDVGGGMPFFRRGSHTLRAGHVGEGGRQNSASLWAAAKPQGRHAGSKTFGIDRSWRSNNNGAGKTM